MTGNNDCPYRRNIDCPFSGAIIFCKHCGYHPVEEKRRKATLEKNSVEIETARRKNVVQLFIKHNKKRVSYSIRRVRKITPSSLYGTMLNNRQSDS